MSLQIRKAQVTDFSAITDIYADSVLNGTGTFDTVPPTAQALMSRFYELRAMSLPYIVAERDKSVIGYAYASPFRARPAYRHGVEDSVYVHPDHYGQGAGKALLSALCEACSEAGYYNIYAVIGDSENAPSIGLHKTLGFTETGRLPAAGHKLGRWLDVVFMAKALRPADTVPEGTGWAG